LDHLDNLHQLAPSEQSERYNATEGSEVRLIVGLGNPGKKYEKTRHNVGFRVIDNLKQRITNNEQRTTILLKPQTYMNLSGKEVAEKARYYKIKPQDIVVIYDDLDLPTGEIRVREKGSSAGHKGAQSIIEALKTEEFRRVRIGIGRPENISPEKYVLENFLPQEEKIMIKAIDEAAEKVIELLSNAKIKSQNAK